MFLTPGTTSASVNSAAHRLTIIDHDDEPHDIGVFEFCGEDGFHVGVKVKHKNSGTLVAGRPEKYRGCEAVVTEGDTTYGGFVERTEQESFFDTFTIRVESKHGP